MPRKGGKRPLAPGEKALWQKVTSSVTPLPEARLPDTPLTDHGLGEAADGTPPPEKRERQKSRPGLGPSLLAEAASTRDHPAPRYDGGDPRQARRVARGRLEIDATLDLHGLTQVQAETRLGHFIDFAAIRGDRVLLVITGKGTAEDADLPPFGEAPRGILRRRFLEWVEQAPLRRRIASVRQAHQRHGGRGAFYVFLKSSEVAL